MTQEKQYLRDTDMEHTESTLNTVENGTGKATQNGRETPETKAGSKPASGRGYPETLKKDFTPEELAANGSKGGIKSGETRRRQRTFRESVNAILRCQVQDPKQREALEALGIDPTMLNQIQLAVYGKAAKGDVEAARFLRDTRGEKPREGVDVSMEEKPLASLDMSKLTDEQLRQLADQRSEE